MKTRERWLLEAIEGLAPLFRAAGVELPVVKVSVGFPPTGGLKKNRRVLGVCFPKTMTKDDVPQIFINPTVEEIESEQGVLAILVHELVHACGIHGHGKSFRKLAVAVGLTGQMRSTVASDWLLDELKGLVRKIGPFPGAAIVNRMDGADFPIKRDKCRMNKCICTDCGYTARVARKWLEFGAPVCPCCHVQMITSE